MKAASALATVERSGFVARHNTSDVTKGNYVINQLYVLNHHGVMTLRWGDSHKCKKIKILFRSCFGLKKILDKTINLTKLDLAVFILR